MKQMIQEPDFCTYIKRKRNQYLKDISYSPVCYRIIHHNQSMDTTIGSIDGYKMHKFWGSNV